MRSKTTFPILMIAAAVVLLLIWLARRSADGDLEQSLPEAGELSSAAGEGAPSVASEPVAAEPRQAPEPQAAPEPPPAPSRAASLPAGASQRGLVETVKDWVGAWSERRVDDYLACYAQSFLPEGGISRRQWEAQRRERLSAPRFVRVAITGLEIELQGDGTARASFLQNYRSDGYSDTVGKTLDLVWEEGRWRIRRERSTDTP